MDKLGILIKLEMKYEKIIRNLLMMQKTGVLATDMKGLPYTTLVAFAATNDLRGIFFATLKDTRKFDNISNNSRVTILIDNRNNNHEDFYKAISITAEGRVKELSYNISEFKQLFIKKHPYLEDFVYSPNCAFLRIHVDRYHYVEKFQNVRILVLDE